MVKEKTCVIQLEELLRTSKSLNKNRIDKKNYEFNMSRYQQLFDDTKDNEMYAKIALKIINDYFNNKASASKYRIKGNVFEIVRNLNFKAEKN